MKKIFICAAFVLLVFGIDAFAQKARKIGDMIAASEKTGNFAASLLGDMTGAGSAEITNLTAVTFPGAAQVKLTGEARKIPKTRKKALDRWLKEYAEKPSEKKFYVNEIAVEEDGARYWLMAHETAVIEKLKNKRKGDEITLSVRVIGSYKKGQTTDYFLLAESVE